MDPVRLFSIFDDPRPRLLREAVEVEQSQLNSRADGLEGTWPAWRSEAARCLDEAREALDSHDVDRGWSLVHQAHRLQVLAYCTAELVAEATYLKQEILSGKVRPWRRQTILHQIKPVFATTDGKYSYSLAARRISLVEALATRDESYEAEYFELACVRRYQAILLTIALVILGAALIGAFFANPRFDDGLKEGWTALGAALSGALGGITSALQRTTRRSNDRIPQKIGSLVASVSRPVIGAIAGVSVFLAVRAGVTQPSEQQVAYLMLVAFGAGFAERLVVRDPRDESSERAPLAAGWDGNGTAVPLPDDEMHPAGGRAGEGAHGTDEALAAGAGPATVASAGQPLLPIPS